MKNKITGEKYYTDECKKRLKTLQQNIFLFADISSKMVKAERLVLMGLSYDYKGTKVKANEWSPGDIREFEHALKQRMGDRLKACAWVFELQKNGHGHYHLAIYADGFIPFPDKNYVNNGRKYKRLWTHGSSNVDWKPKGVYYLARYVGKEAQKDFMNFPKNARAYGIYFQDQELRKKFRDAITFKKGLRVSKLYKLEGWESDIEYLGSGYKLEYLKTVFENR
jgi:hypothetical protein